MASRPNVLFITSDQQHWRTLGCVNPELETPHLDRLAADGVLCRRAYCPNPTCTPTRASIITGLYPSQHGAWSLGTKLFEDRPTVGDEFRAADYRTALVGKAHFQPLRGTDDFPSLEAYPILQDLEFWRDFHGPFYGFDHVELARNHTDEAHVGQHYALWMEEKGLADWRDHFRRPTGTRDPQAHRWSIPEEYHYNTWITERTNALLDRFAAADEPFFMWASFFDPHPSYLVPRPWDEMYDPRRLTLPPPPTPDEHAANPPHFALTQQEHPDFSPWDESHRGNHGMTSHAARWRDRDALARDIATYYGMISCLDHSVGAILGHLDRLGLRQRTLVVFTSDHGHLFGQHGLVEKGPFHYEDLLRVPFIARWPGTIPAGATTDDLLSLVDLAPTFLAACGLPVPAEMVGRNLLPALTGRGPVRDHVLVENRHEPTTIHLRTIVTDRHKLTAYFGRTYGELYDLAADPDERRNLWAEPAAAGLKGELLLKLAHAEMAKDPLPMPRVAVA